MIKFTCGDTYSNSIFLYSTSKLDKASKCELSDTWDAAIDCHSYIQNTKDNVKKHTYKVKK